MGVYVPWPRSGVRRLRVLRIGGGLTKEGGATMSRCCSSSGVGQQELELMLVGAGGVMLSVWEESKVLSMDKKTIIIYYSVLKRFTKNINRQVIEHN